MALCPHCQNALPEAATGRCPNCGGDIDQPAVPSAPAPPSADLPPPLPVPLSPEAAVPPPPLPGGGLPPPGAQGIPWDDRERLGLASALIETTKQILAHPVTFFRVMPTSGGIGSPLLYAVIMGWLGVVAAGFYSALFNSVVGSGMAAFGESPEFAQAFYLAQSWGGFLVQVVFGGVMVAIGVFIFSGIFHVMLLILGGSRRDFEATFRVVSFAYAPYVLALIPFCGGFVAGVWWIVLAVIGLTHAHEITGGKAAAAVLLPIVLFCCCCVGLIALVAGAQ
jgi:hypothetical protein